MTSKERAYLRGLANSIDAIFQIGKGGISDNLISQLSDALEARELIKVSVLETAPANAKLFAQVEDIIEPKWFNKNGEVKVKFTRLELPDGRTADLDGYVYNDRDGYLKENPWKKVGLYTLGGAVVGTGAGMGIGIPSDETGAGFAIGTPVGAGMGAITGLVTKGLTYSARAGETVYIKLLNDVSINEDL